MILCKNTEAKLGLENELSIGFRIGLGIKLEVEKG